jgi:hypothetical protein
VQPFQHPGLAVARQADAEGVERGRDDPGADHPGREHLARGGGAAERVAGEDRAEQDHQERRQGEGEDHGLLLPEELGQLDPAAGETERNRARQGQNRCGHRSSPIRSR